MSTDTPAAAGFRWPAEWEPHRATWLAWPHNREDWPGKFTPIPYVYADIVRRLSRVEQVCIIVEDVRQEHKIKRLLKQVGAVMEAVLFFPQPSNRSWVRDTCPIFVKNKSGEVAVTDWHFNGWAKYDNWELDDALPATIAGELGLRRWAPEVNGKRVVLEGGSIDTNGAGLMLTTEECLLSPIQARNPDLSREQIEQVFADYFGIQKTLWLRNGIAGDDTHGHVDDLARFVDESTIVCVEERNRNDANYEPLQENLALLREMTDQQGNPLRTVTLPMPEPVYFDGQRLPASYANFYIANASVLVPTFNDPQDRVALNTIQMLFPGREVIGIHCLDLVLGLGTLHCMTQQQPT